MDSIVSSNINETIPTEFGNLLNIPYFNVQGTDISGMILSDMGNMTQLESFILCTNNIVGPLPEQWCEIEKIHALRPLWEEI